VTESRNYLYDMKRKQNYRGLVQLSNSTIILYRILILDSL